MQQHKVQPAAGHAAQALQISERARARSLIEALGETRVDIRQGVDQAGFTGIAFGAATDKPAPK